MAGTTPNLTMTLTLAEQELIRDFTQFAKRFEKQVQANETKVNAIKSKAAAEAEATQKKSQAKVAATEAEAQAKREQKLKNFYAQQEITQLKAQNKMLAANNSWSKKMTTGLNTLVASVRTFAIAYATIFVGSALKNALNFAGSLADMADQLNLTTNQVYSLQTALVDAGGGEDAITKIIGKINGLKEAATDSELKTLRKYGIVDPEGLSNIELFDELLNNTALSYELLGDRQATLLRGLKENVKVSSFAEIEATFKPLAKNLDGVARSADAIGTSFLKFKRQVTEQLATALVALEPQITEFIETLSEGFKNVDFEAFANSIILTVKAFSALFTTIKNIAVLSMLLDTLVAIVGVLELLIGTISVLNTAFVSLNGLGTIQNFNTALKEIAATGKSAIQGIGVLQKVTLSFAKTFYYLDFVAAKLADVFTLVGNWVGKVFPRLGTLITKLPIIGWLIQLSIAIYRVYDAMKSGSSVWMALRLAFLGFVNDLTFGLTPLNEHIKVLKKLQKQAKETKEAYQINLTNNGYETISDPLTSSPVPEGVSRLYNETDDQYKKRMEQYKKEHRTVKDLLEDEITTRKERLEQIEKELVGIDKLIDKYADDAVGLTTLLEKYDALVDEKEKLLGLTEQEITAVENLYKTLFEASDAYRDNKTALEEWAKIIQTSKWNDDGFFYAVQQYLATLDAINKYEDPFGIKKFNKNLLDGTQLREDLVKAIDAINKANNKIPYLPKKPDNNEENNFQPPSNFFEIPFRQRNIPKDATDDERKRLERLNKVMKILAEQSANVYQGVFDYISIGLDNQIIKTQKLIELERQRWENQSNALREAGLESSVYYRNLERNAIALEKKRQQQLESQQAKAYDVQKAANIGQAIQAGAVSFVEALPNFILAALVATVTAGQVALIASQTNPYRRAFGGLIPGGNPNRDSVPILATGGEFITNRRATAENRDLLERINSGQKINTSPNINIHINGGLVDKKFVNNELIPLIKQGIKNGY